MTQPEMEGSDANDSNLQSSESQDDTKDDAQSVCIEMAGFVKRSFQVIL